MTCPRRTTGHDLRLRHLTILLTVVISSHGVLSLDYATDIITPIADQPDGPITGIEETRTYQHEDHQGFIGCSYKTDLCNEDEVCYDDNLLGRCMDSANLEFPSRREDLSFDEASQLNKLAEYILGLNLDWEEPYVQCILHTLQKSLIDHVEYTTELCDWAFATLEPLEIPDSLFDEDFGPEKRLETRTSDVWEKQDPHNVFSVRQEKDGGILIEPSQNFDLDKIPQHQREWGKVYQTDDHQQQPENTDGHPIIWLEDMSDDPSAGYVDYNDDFGNGDIMVDRYRRGLNEGEEDYEELMFPLYNDDNELLNRHKFDDQLEYPEEEPLEYESEYPAEDQAGEKMVFNRNERLDVKKPGPSWLPSGEFLYDDVVRDEPKPEGLVGDPFGPRSANVSTKGQEEYEMPLLAPVKDKRVVQVDNAEADPEMDKQFVHMFLNNRFDTWSQGSDLIDALADAMGVPHQALTDRKIEDHHVQFKVDPNPQEVDAKTVVDHFISNKELQKRISSELGIDVANALSGSENDYLHLSSSRGMSTQTLILISLATMAAIFAALATLLVLKTRICPRNNNDKLSCDPMDAERGKVQEEYKQLCRDWSRSTKTAGIDNKLGDSPGKTSSSQVHKLQSQDSKNSDKSSTSSWSEEPSSTNMDISTGHMVLAYMEDHLKNKQRLEQEWVGLCSYEAEPCATTVAYKAENKKKNRYPDKLPYDHNRVILNAVLNATNSDYINASTVSDSDPRNPSYIVTQGPLAQTVADFWQMIWEQGCVVIVMLSRLQDNGLQLCQRYWPEEGSEQYHIFEVHLVSEHVWCEDYLVRSVYLKNTRTGETRTVTQFHFRSWPAQSVPASTKALLEFRRKVNKSYRGRSCPICIHCSDGVGRTGTYVLIDMVLNRMAKGCKEIDIAATLEHIRDQRSGMVQTRPQFEFCLMAVAEEVHAILKALLP